MNSNVISSSEMMLKISDFISVDDNRLSTAWKDVVSKIHSLKDEGIDNEKRIPIGERLAGNTRVVDLKNKVLLIETDHSGWIQYLKFYQKFIINGLKRNLPDMEINSFAFRLSGSNVHLYNTYEERISKSNNEYYKKIENQEKQVNEFYKNQNSADNKLLNAKKKSENILPDDLLKRLSAMQKSAQESVEK